MDHTLFEKLLDKNSALKEKYSYEKWFSKVSGTYSGVTQKLYFDAEDFFEKEQIQEKKIFLDISEDIASEIIEKTKADEYTKSLIITYLDTKQSFDFDLELFQKIILKISKVDKKPNIVNCYVPIYGLESDFESFELPNDLLTIKQITSSELDTITNLSFLNSEYVVGKRFRNLQYVAHFSFNLENNDSMKKKYLLQDSLRLTKPGFLKVGDAFYRYIPGLKGMSITPKIGEELPPNLSAPLKLEDSDKKKLYDEIFQNLKNLDDSYGKDKTRYINSSIRRFGYIYKASIPEDKISDLIIAMETLLSNDPIEIGVKMSLRVAMLLGDTEESKQSIQQFVKKCYSKRSEIVHGKKKKPFVVDGKDLPYEIVVGYLENYVRSAINKIIILHMKKKSQQAILDDLDSIIVNRKNKNLLD